MSQGKRKSAFLRAIERKRDAARQEQPAPGEETNEAPPNRIMRERPAPLFPAKKRRPLWK